MELKSRVVSIWFLMAFFTVSGMMAQVDIRNITFRGRVQDISGRGIANVSVSDGLNIVQTNNKGVYQLLSTAEANYVFISIPSGYEVPFKDNAPHFFRKVPEEYSSKQIVNFELKRKKEEEKQHVTIVWADPQVYYLDEIPELQEAADDVKELLSLNYKDVPAHGLVAGDMIGWLKDADTLYEPIKRTINSIGVPFFYAVGNHDMDTNSRTNYSSKKTYNRYFGPTYYSFNRGDIHYIVLDNVFYIGRGGSSIGYLDERQFAWLGQDLKTLAEGSTVIITMHIPTYSPDARNGAFHKEQMNKVLQNRSAFYKMLEPFNVHLFSGHEHYTENYEINKTIFEHVHTSLGGLFWMAPWSWDGSPRGYGVYEVDGDNVEWYFKPIGKSKEHQFNVYPVGSNSHKEEAIVVNVWNYDPSWKIYWYEDGVKMGEMEQFRGYDSSIYNYVNKNKENFNHPGIGYALTDHLFFAIPKVKSRSIKVKVVDRFGNVYIQEIENKKDANTL